jgi:hypothetical protein
LLDSLELAPNDTDPSTSANTAWAANAGHLRNVAPYPISTSATRATATTAKYVIAIRAMTGITPR